MVMWLNNKARRTILGQILLYFSAGRAHFYAEEEVSKSKAEMAYQGSVTSAKEVAKNSTQRIHTSAEFLREVLKG